MKVKVKCQICDNFFMGGYAAKYCPACKKTKNLKQRFCTLCGADITGQPSKKMCKECSLSIRGGKKLAREQAKNKKTLAETVKELEKYNSRHGTNYSYGQAVQRGII